MKINQILAVGILAAATAAQAAPVAVASYSMIDGAPLWGAYYDNLYTGSNNGGFLSGGTGDLTDGVLSASVAAGYGAWAPYVLWYNLSPVITFDLGAVHTLDSVMAYFKYYPQAAVYIPESVGVRFSTDGVNFGASQLRSLAPAERYLAANDMNGIYQLLAAPGVGRYVELTLNNLPENAWIALSEVVFDGSLGGASNVPEPASVALMLAALGATGVFGRRTRL